MPLDYLVFTYKGTDVIEFMSQVNRICKATGVDLADVALFYTGVTRLTSDPSESFFYSTPVPIGCNLRRKTTFTVDYTTTDDDGKLVRVCGSMFPYNDAYVTPCFTAKIPNKLGLTLECQ